MLGVALVGVLTVGCGGSWVVGDIRVSGAGPLPTPPDTMGCEGVVTSFPAVGLVIEGRRCISTDGLDSVKLPSASCFTATSACC